MLGKLKKGIAAAKDKAGDGAMATAVEKISPALAPHIKKLQDMDVAVIINDESFKEKFINPTLVAIAAATSGASKMIPKFDNRFTGAMLHIRDEILNMDEEKNTITLVDKYQDKLPDVLKEGLSKSA